MKSRTFKTGILASGKLLTSLVGLISAAVLARLLDRYGYATYRQTLLAYGVLGPLLQLGLPQALYYFLPGEKTRARSVVVENLTTLAVMGFVFSAFLLLGGAQLLANRFDNPDLERTLKLLAPYPLLMLPAASFTACMMARDRVIFAATYNVISRLVMLVAVVGACLIWRTAESAVIGMVASACVICIPAVSVMLWVADGGSWRPTRPGIWKQVAYSVPLGLAAMIGAININLDKIVVSALCPAETFAVYVNGAMEIPLVGILTGSAMAVLLPEMTRMLKAEQFGACHDLWKRAVCKTAVVILPVMVFLFILAPDVITILYSASYIESATPFRIYLLLLPIRIAHYGVIFMSIGKSSLVLWRVVVGLGFNVVLNILLVKKFGYMGAAVATVLVVYLWMMPFNIYWIRRLTGWKLRTMLPYRRVLSIMLISLLAGLPVVWIAARVGHSAYLRVLIGGAVYCAICLPLFERMKYTHICRTIHKKWRLDAH